MTLPEILREAAKGAPKTYKDLLESGAHRIDQLERLQDEDREARKRHWYEKRRMERCFNKALLEQEALLKEAADALEDTSDIGARIRTRLYELAQPFVRSDSFNPSLRCNERGEWVEKEGSDALTEWRAPPAGAAAAGLMNSEDDEGKTYWGLGSLPGFLISDEDD